MTNSTQAQPPAPQTDLAWDSSRARQFADQALDLWQEFLEALPDLPIGNSSGQRQIAEAVRLPIQDAPMPDDQLFGYLRRILFESSVYAGHPRFMAYITGAGTVPGAVADLLAAGVNMNLGSWRLSPSATEIELLLGRWFAEQFGLPQGSGGLIVSGDAMANFVALAAARDNKAGWDVRAKGVFAGPPLVLYASQEVHVVTDRAADMLGLGTDAVRKIPVDGDYRIRVAELEAAIKRDKDAGLKPFAVVANAGTVATGAIDDIGEIASICAAEELWLHIDAAYGGPAVLTDDLRPLFAGIEKADSIAFDPHKWIYTPHSGGRVLMRDFTHLADTFAVHPAYVQDDKEHSHYGQDMTELSPQFSRGFQALKIWVSLLAHGRQAYSQRISHDAALARYLGAQVEQRPEFELMTPVNLSICCFLYVPAALPANAGRDKYLSLLNERLMTDLQRDGRVFCSNAVLEGNYVLRACIVNFRTEATDIDALLDVAAEIGSSLDTELRPAELRSVGR